MVKIKLDRPEFKQIIDMNSVLYALDGNGDVWYYNGNGAKWIQVSMTKEEYANNDKK